MLSIVLATHNEAANLERCLNAIKDLADEIVIVDGDSEDQTVAIADRFQVKVIPTTNKTNFHINKQMAMDAAQGDLVLQLDADEVVDQELHDFIQESHQKLLNNEKLPAAWWLKRRNWFMGKFLRKGGQYPDPVIRLYQKGKAHLPQKDVHEQMVVEGEIGWAKGHLLHYSSPTFADYLRKFNTYTSFKAQQLAESKTSINLINIIQYFLLKPLFTFLSLFFRHRGYVDGVAGFTFALFSGLHYPVAYMKLWEVYEKQRLKRPANLTK